MHACDSEENQARNAVQGEGNQTYEVQGLVWRETAGPDPSRKFPHANLHIECVVRAFRQELSFFDGRDGRWMSGCPRMHCLCSETMRQNNLVRRDEQTTSSIATINATAARQRTTAHQPGVSCWPGLPLALLELIYAHLELPSLLAASAACKAWHEASLSPLLALDTRFLTQQHETPRALVARLRSLAAWLSRRGGAVRSLVVSSRAPKAWHQRAMRLAREAVAAAAAGGQLRVLTLETSYSFKLDALTATLTSLESLCLCSRQGSLTFAGTWGGCGRLSALVLSASRTVCTSASLQFPPHLLRLHIEGLADSLPWELTQLAELEQLVVQHAQLSEGVQGMDYEPLGALAALTSLRLEAQEGTDVESWLPPLELATLSRLRELSFHDNNCW